MEQSQSRSEGELHAVKLIDRAFENNDTFLDLGNCGLRALPKEIYILSDQLIGLNLGRTIDFGENELFISGNNHGVNVFDVDDLSGLGQFSKLKKLGVSGCDLQLRPFKSNISIKKLEELDISNNNAGESILDYLTTPRSLRALNISGNSIGDRLFEWLRFWPRLEILISRNNDLTDAGLVDFKLLRNTKLRRLDLADNSMSGEQLEAIRNLPLLYFNVANNLIGNKGLQAISNLRNLKHLWLDGNQLDQSSVDIFKEFKSDLKTLSLSNNIFDDAGVEALVNTFENLENISLSGSVSNSFEPIANDRKALKQRFEQAAASKLVARDRFRIIILGNTRTGKTALSSYMELKKFPPVDASGTALESTHGILHWKWKLNQKVINVWDFGGQDFYHATHNLFNQRDTLYIVLHCNEDNTLVEMNEQGQNHSLSYWLGNLCDVFYNDTVNPVNRPDPPKVLVIQTKSDALNFRPQWLTSSELAMLYEEVSVDEKNTEIQGSVQISLLELVNQLQVSVAVAKRKGGRSAEWRLFEETIERVWESQEKAMDPGWWVRLREDLLPKLRSEGYWYMDIDAFNEECNQSLNDLGLDLDWSDDPFYAFRKYLHGIGEIVHFDHVESLADTLFLDVKAFIQQLYNEVLPMEVRTKGKGRIKIDYTKENVQAISKEKLVQLLAADGLIFKVPGSGDTYVVPQYLPEDPHKERLGSLIHFRFALHFLGYMSRSLISKTIAHYAAENSTATYFRDSIAFNHPEYKEVHCLIRFDTRQQKVYVHATEHADKFFVLKEIFQRLLDIAPMEATTHSGHRKQITSSKAVIPSWKKRYVCISLDESSMKQSSAGNVKYTNESFVTIQEIESAVHQKMAYLVDGSGRRCELTPLHHVLLNPKGKKPQRIFISYSKHDLNYKVELEKHFSALKRDGVVETWSDVQIQGGDNWDDDIRKQLEMADIVLLLLSPDFMATDYIWNVEIAEAKRSDKLILPVFLRPCDWNEDTFNLKQYQGLPAKEEWIVRNGQSQFDEAFLEVMKGLRTILNG